MLIHHEDPNGEKAILSIWLNEVAPKDETKIPAEELDNKFLN
jgi:hypothetical protein